MVCESDQSGRSVLTLRSYRGASSERRPGAVKILENVAKPALIALVVYAIVAVIVTRGVILDPGLSVFQKIAQAMIVWFIPVLGMSAVLLMQGNSHTRAEMKSLVPFPFYLVAPAKLGDGSLSPHPQDGAGEYCGTDAADGD